MICKSCGQGKMARAQRKSLLEKNFYVRLGLYPWLCPLCKVGVLLMNRGDIHRTGRTVKGNDKSKEGSPNT